MSSPTLFAGKNPITALAVRSFSFTMRCNRFLRIVEQFLRPAAHHGVLKDLGILPAQFPGVKEGRPVDVGNDLTERHGSEYAHPVKPG